MNERKIKEAEGHMAKAKKALAKTMFKWNEDWLTAAPEYGKAAVAYQAGGDLDNAKEAFEKASEAHAKLGQSATAAMDLEKAALVALKQKRGESVDEAVKYYQTASMFYLEVGEIDRAAGSMSKGAKEVESTSVDRASDLYAEACTLLLAQDRGFMGVNTFRGALQFNLKNNKWKESLALLEQMVVIFKSVNQGNNLAKSWLSITIVQLTMNDFVAAERSFTLHLQDSEYLKAPECELEEDLIQAYNNMDQIALEDALKKQGWNFLDNQVIRLVKKLRIGGGGGGGKSKAAAPVKAAAPAPAPAPTPAPAPVPAPAPPPAAIESQSEETKVSPDDTKEDEPEGGVELDEEIKKAQALAVSLTNFSTNHSPFPPTRHPPPCRQQKRGTQKSSKAKPISTKMSLTLPKPEHVWGGGLRAALIWRASGPVTPAACSIRASPVVAVAHPRPAAQNRAQGAGPQPQGVPAPPPAAAARCAKS
jgi:hypothetical protein